MRRTAIAIAATAAYLLLLAAVYWIGIAFFKIDVVFYASLRAAALATAIAAVAVFATPALHRFRAFERAQLVVIWALLGYVAAISVPTLIDRSLSFYILEKLQQRGGAIRLDKFNYIFTDEYMREHKLVLVRLTEQQASGTIVVDGGCVRLTPRGDRLATFGQFFRKNLLPKQRLLDGEYTDQLTDPFKRSDVNPNYLCQPAPAGK